MSLSGIFDPVVRAYFKNRSGGSGGSSDVVKVAFWQYGMVCEQFDSGDGVWTKISTECPTIDELAFGTLVVDDKVYYLTVENGNIFESDTGVIITPDPDSSEFFMSINNDMAEMMGMPSGGIWVLFDLSKKVQIAILWDTT